MISILLIIIYLIIAPILGGFIFGIDRKVTARIQNRQGPPIIQPFYDVIKLWNKEKAVSNPVEKIFILGYLILTIFSGVIFFSGGDLLLIVFVLALAHTLLIVSAYSANAPYSSIGAERELISIMVIEPILILLTIGFYIVTDSFLVSDIITKQTPAIYSLPAIFLLLIISLTLKLQKSPYDISTSHHAHQELVKGLTTSFSGRTLAEIEIAHWYETILLLGFVFLFFSGSPILGISAVCICYLLEIFIDNLYPRFTWQMTVKSLWIATIIFGIGNIVYLNIISGGVM
ncbi:MAG TPA: NADH-quinone oxidoreductase subunit H [Methanocorpusculum sp.]|nr:NADH-quinone oxidoreductase subunit H [Methanocorpusculum sp.]